MSMTGQVRFRKVMILDKLRFWSDLLLPLRTLTLLSIGCLIILPFNARRTSSSGTTEVYPFRKLPCLNSSEEQKCRNDNDCPLPGDHLMLEHHTIDNRDVQCREDSNESKDDRPEEELVATNIVNPIQQSVCVRRLQHFNDIPLSEVLLAARLHPEKASSHVNQLPCKEQCEPSKTRKACRPGPKHCITIGGV